MTGRSLEHEGDAAEVAETRVLLERAVRLFEGHSTPVGLKVAEVLTAALLRGVLPQYRSEVMERWFAHVRQRVQGDA